MSFSEFRIFISSSSKQTRKSDGAVDDTQAESRAELLSLRCPISLKLKILLHYIGKLLGKRIGGRKKFNQHFESSTQHTQLSTHNSQDGLFSPFDSSTFFSLSSPLFFNIQRKTFTGIIFRNFDRKTQAVSVLYHPFVPHRPCWLCHSSVFGRVISAVRRKRTERNEEKKVGKWKI